MPSLFFSVTKMNRLAALCAAVAGLCLAGCSEEPVPVENAETPATRVYDVRGFVRSAPDLAERSISIEHEDIRGFMPAMTMPFEFRDPKVVEGLSLGDAIAFKVSVTSDDSWITDIQRVSPASVQIPAAKAVQQPANAERLKEGDHLPDFELVDQSGRTIRRESFGGKPLVVTFIFTRCAIPNFCPLMSKNFATLQQAVRADAALGGRVNLLSISFDERDTPEILAEYGANFSDDLDSWRFATGKPDEVRKLIRGFAVHVQPDGVTISHGLATVLIDADGVIRNIWRGNGWRTEDVLTALRTL